MLPDADIVKNGIWKDGRVGLIQVIRKMEKIEMNLGCIR